MERAAKERKASDRGRGAPSFVESRGSAYYHLTVASDDRARILHLARFWRHASKHSPDHQLLPALHPSSSFPTMVVRLRLSPHRIVPTARQHVFHIVACNAPRARDSAPLETIGVYDPVPKHVPVQEGASRSLLDEGKPVETKFSKRIFWSHERLQHWLKSGAQPTKRVAWLMQKVRPSRVRVQHVMGGLARSGWYEHADGCTLLTTYSPITTATNRWLPPSSHDRRTSVSRDPLYARTLLLSAMLIYVSIPPSSALQFLLARSITATTDRDCPKPRKRLPHLPPPQAQSQSRRRRQRLPGTPRSQAATPVALQLREPSLLHARARHARRKALYRHLK